MFERINELAAEEEELWSEPVMGDGLDDAQRRRMETIKAEPTNATTSFVSARPVDPLG